MQSAVFINLILGTSLVGLKITENRKDPDAVDMSHLGYCWGRAGFALKTRIGAAGWREAGLPPLSEQRGRSARGTATAAFVSQVLMRKPHQPPSTWRKTLGEAGGRRHRRKPPRFAFPSRPLGAPGA